jgi:hypothetical protein
MGFGDRGTHGWIESDGIIIDITADQFPDITAPALVTRDRTWHDQRFGRQRRPREVLVRPYDDYDSAAYSAIQRYLSSL